MPEENAQTETDSADLSLFFLVFVFTMIFVMAPFAAIIISVEQHIDFFLALLIVVAVFTGICGFSFWACDKPWLDTFFEKVYGWLGVLPEDDVTIGENHHDSV